MAMSISRVLGDHGAVTIDAAIGLARTGDPLEYVHSPTRTDVFRIFKSFPNLNFLTHFVERKMTCFSLLILVLFSSGLK